MSGLYNEAQVTGGSTCPCLKNFKYTMQAMLKHQVLQDEKGKEGKSQIGEPKPRLVPLEDFPKP